MSTDMLKVAEGIMDSAAEEYRAENLSGIIAVQNYAENGLNIHLTDKEANIVLEYCRAMQARLGAGEIPGSNDWYHDFEKPIREYCGD